MALIRRMYFPSASRWPRWGFPEMLCLGGGLLLLACLTWGILAYTPSPLFVPIMVIGLVGGAVVVLRPELGVFIMFAMILFKPDAVQGLGWFSPNNLIGMALTGMLFFTIVLGGPADFLRSNQIKAFILLSVLMAVNWYVVGRIDAPAYLADRDTTGRSLYRFAVQFALLTFVLAYVRRARQLLSLNALYVGAILVTVALALLGVTPEGPAGGGGTGAKHLTHLAAAAAGDPSKVEAARAAATIGVQAAENANRLAFFSLTAISILWFALLHYRSLLLRLVGGATILSLVLIVFKTGSRSGVVGLLLLAVLLLAQSRLSPGRLAIVILLGFVAVGLVVALVPDMVMNRLESMVVTQEEQPKSLVESTVRRLTVLAAGMKLVADNPIMGVGIGNFRWMTALDPQYGGISMAAHNAYLLALAEGGIVLLAGYLILLWLTARDLSRTLKAAARLPEVGLDWLILATRTNLALLLVFSMFAEAWKEIFFVMTLATAGVLVQVYQRAAAARAAPA
jgi:O-antigen ligase